MITVTYSISCDGVDGDEFCEASFEHQTWPVSLGGHTSLVDQLDRRGWRTVTPTEPTDRVRHFCPRHHEDAPEEPEA